MSNKLEQVQGIIAEAYADLEVKLKELGFGESNPIMISCLNLNDDEELDNVFVATNISDVVSYAEFVEMCSYVFAPEVGDTDSQTIVSKDNKGDKDVNGNLEDLWKQG